MPGKDEEFYLGNSFALEVDSVAVSYFTEVSGLESATDVTEIVQQMKDGKTNDAMRNGSIIIYDNKMAEQGRWNFVKAWPSKLSIGALSAGSNDAVDIELSLEYEQLAPAG